MLQWSSIKKLNSLANIVCFFHLPLILHVPSSEIRILPAAVDTKQQTLASVTIVSYVFSVDIHAILVINTDDTSSASPK